MVVIVDKDAAADVQKILEDQGETVSTLGTLIPGSGAVQFRGNMNWSG